MASPRNRQSGIVHLAIGNSSRFLPQHVGSEKLKRRGLWGFNRVQRSSRRLVRGCHLPYSGEWAPSFPRVLPLAGSGRKVRGIR